MRLTETEAYLGFDDPACHTFGGRRTAAHRGDVGRGREALRLLHLRDALLRQRGDARGGGAGGGAAAGRPGGGGRGDGARRRGRADRHGLLDGPAKLCQGLGIDRALNGADLTRNDAVWLADDGSVPQEGSVWRGPG